MKKLLLIFFLLSHCCLGETYPIVFPDGYDEKTEVIRGAVERAQGRIDRFAVEHGWEEQCRPVPYDSVEIYQDAENLTNRVRAMYNLDPSVELPGPPVAGLEKRVLMAVTPESFRKLRSDQKEIFDFDKLLAHEIGHRLHVAILDGDEEAMGPRWFYEGFAVIASGQLNRGPAEVEEAEEFMEANDYEAYGKLLRLCMTRWDLPTLVRKAGDENFNEWVLEGLRERS